MKRKIFSVLLTLVLVCSFSLVMAVPAVADPGTLNVRPFVVQATGGATAAWSTSAARTGSWGVNIGTESGGTDVGRVILAWDQNLSTITNMAYWYKLQAGNGAANWDSGPYVVLALDTTNDTSADTWVVHHMFAMSPGLDTTWLKWELSDGPIASQYMATGDGTSMWHVAGATTIANASWAEIVTQFGSDTVLEIKIAVGDWASDIETRHYVDDIAINGTTYYGKIQDAIDTATAGDTISVAAGTYVEDLAIPGAKTNLEFVGATGATIKGVAITDSLLWPTAAANIEILASGVKIHGFTIQGPDPASGYYSSGVIIGAPNVEIYDNAFEVPNASTMDDISQGLQTYHKVAVPGVDISGLNIYDNTFTNHGTGTVGFEAIYINRDADSAVGSVNITDNEFTGDVFRGITVERSNATISGNSLITDILVTVAWQGILVRDYNAETQDAVTVVGNSVKGSASGKGFADGIKIGKSGQALTDISVLGNTVEDSRHAIQAEGTGSIAILDNTINDFIKSGIFVKDLASIQIDGNTISTTSVAEASNGIQVGYEMDPTATTGTVNGNQVSGCSWSGYDPGRTYEDPEEPLNWTGSGILVIAPNSALEISENEVQSCDVGLDIEAGSGTLIINNDVHDNSYGFVLWNADPAISLNNIYDNSLYGVYRTFGLTGILNAINNWWGHPTGPTASPGSGDPVDAGVLYEPWLLEPVVPGEPPPTTFDTTQVLNVGWTLVSTGDWIDPAATVGANVILAYNYTPSLGYFEVTPADLVPVNAIYLKTVDGGGLGITYSGGVPGASSKDLEAGWNLISSANPLPASAVLSPLKVVQIGQMVGPGLATFVSQKTYNRNTPLNYYLATLTEADWTALESITLNPFDGYWVYMNAAKNFGVIPQ